MNDVMIDFEALGKDCPHQVKYVTRALNELKINKQVVSLIEKLTNE